MIRDALPCSCNKTDLSHNMHPTECKVTQSRSPTKSFLVGTQIILTSLIQPQSCFLLFTSVNILERYCMWLWPQSHHNLISSLLLLLPQFGAFRSKFILIQQRLLVIYSTGAVQLILNSFNGVCSSQTTSPAKPITHCSNLQKPVKRKKVRFQYCI